MIETIGTESIYSRELYKCVTTRYIYYMCNHITEQAKDATQNGQPQTAPTQPNPIDHSQPPSPPNTDTPPTTATQSQQRQTACLIPLLAYTAIKHRIVFVLVIYLLGVEDR